MSNREGDGYFVLFKVIVLGVVAAVAAMRGCVVRDGLTSDLTPVAVEQPEEIVPATKFSTDQWVAHNFSLNKGEPVELTLEPGLNVLDIECDRFDGDIYNYDFHGALGEIEAGQPVNFAGTQDDVFVSRPNGEQLRITSDCPGGKHNTHSTVFVAVGL